MVISGINSSWKAILSGIKQESVLGLDLFICCVNRIQDAV